MKKIIALSLTLAILLCACLTLASCNNTSAPVPIVCGEAGMNSTCGIATYGVDYYSLGLKAGDMAADILLNGKKASEMPVQIDPNPTLIVNKAVADDIGFTIPDSVLSKAGSSTVTPVTRVETVFKDDNADFTVGILQLIQHDALDKCNKGFQDQLSVRLAAANKTIKVIDNNASGEEANNATIAANLVSQNVDLIYTIATSSSQAAVSATSETDIPVIFNAVTDPVGAGLVNSMDAPGKNVTGVSDINPVAQQIKLIAELLGKEDIKIGFLYTSSETNSVYQVRDLAIPCCNEMGYEYAEQGIADINDLEYAILKLKQAGVDAIYIPTDNILANGAATIHTFNVGD